MKRILTYLIATLVVFAMAVSCEKPELAPQEPGTEQPEDPKEPDTPETPDEPQEPDTPVVAPGEDATPDPKSGISVSPQKPDADGACTITLTALETNEFKGYTGDVYMHIGVIIDGEWKFVESDWNVNDDKFKMASVGEGVWALEIPNVREFFTLAEPTTPIVMIGMVARSAEEHNLVNEKGESYKAKLQTRPDQFVSLTDNKNAYVPWAPGELVLESMPGGLKHGINYTGSNEVTLVFYDKDKNGKRYDYCCVVGDFSEWERKREYEMKRDEAAGCWWTTITVDDPSKEYRFQYRMAQGENEIRVQDPYSEIYYHGDDHWITSSTYPDLPVYPDGARGFISAFQIQKPVYAWQNDSFSIKDEDDLVIYELLLRDFTATGDLNGAISKLDYLAELGITAIELMPVQEFEGNDSWGYAPVGYFALDKAYGTREMYKRFIDECHARGIAVIIDVVYNHTTGAHPWARLYWNGSDNVSSNNPWYNVVTPHGFGVYQDLNHANEMVKNHINESLKYLIDEYHVDGFRFDLTKGFTNNSGKDNSYDQSRVDYLTGYYNTIKAANPNAVMILEHFVGEENYELGKRGMKVWQNLNNAYCQTAMGYNSENDFNSLQDINEQWVEFGTYVGFMESHDEERVGYKQAAYGNIGGGSSTGGGSTGGSGEKWGIIGRGNDWDNDLFMTFVDGMYFADNVTFTSTDYFKFRKNASWDVNFGLNPKGTKAQLGKANILVKNDAGGEDMMITTGTYDVYFLPDPGVAWFMADGVKPESFWGVVGTINSWSAPDVELKGTEDGFFVAEDVTLSSTDLFKIRGGGTWDDRFNYGAAKEGGETIAINKAYTMTLGSSSQNMSVAAGTYDIWFRNGTIWVMTDGQKPAEAGGDIDTGLPEDAHTVGMRRLGLNAAFFLTVPGPKMIWQFGELGYDISIEDNGRTGKKPVKWDYLDDPARKQLYDTYASLLQFRKENPRFFDSDTGFRWYVSGNEWPGRYLFNAVDGRNIAIFGNFGSGSQAISVELPHGGNWYNYYNRDEVWTGKNHTPTLKEGEFIFLVDWK